MIAELLVAPQAGDRFDGLPGRGDDTRTYGGLIVAQALAAATATADGRPCHSLHALFAGAGEGARPLSLAVERLRDGRSFSARSVRAEQDGRLLALATVSFHAGDDGPSHQVAMPEVAAPEMLVDQREIRRRNAVARGKPARRSVAEELIDARPATGTQRERLLWLRCREPLDDSVATHQAMLAFASDMGLVHAQVAASNAAGGGALEAASLDHAIWFHRHFRADDWLLHVQSAPVAHGGRGQTFGTIFTRDGILVASVAQEVLVRRAAR